MQVFEVLLSMSQGKQLYTRSATDHIRFCMHAFVFLCFDMLLRQIALPQTVHEIFVLRILLTNTEDLFLSLGAVANQLTET